MIIDFHTHLSRPDAAPPAPGLPRTPTGIETVLEAQRQGGVDITIVSSPMHNLRHMDHEQQLEALNRQNEYMAEAQDKYPTIYAIASASPFGGERFVRAFERAVRQLGLKGAWILSSLPGHYPDDDDAMPFFQAAVEMDVPVVIHPPSVGFGEERMRDYRLASSIGRPMDNALAIARLIVRGIFEKFPALKLVGTHLGGGICEMIGRMDYAYNLGDEAAFLGPYTPMLITRQPSDYLRMMYLESTCYHPPAARCALETVGPDHFVFGTDAPPLKSMKKQGVEVIRALALPPAVERKVFCDNAKTLLKI